MYRLSVTVIEKFRRYMKEVSPFDTEESLLECIKGTFIGNDKTKMGQAFHKILEGRYQVIPGATKKGHDLIKADGVLFTHDQAKPALNFRKRHPRISHEINTKQVYETIYGDIQVSGRVDALEGLSIRDGKLKFRNIDPWEYTESCQWKFYNDMVGVSRFYYDLFEVKGFEKLSNHDGTLIIDPEVEVIDRDSIECIGYKDMHDELICLLNEFLEYVESRGLSRYLKFASLYESAFW